MPNSPKMTAKQAIAWIALAAIFALSAIAAAGLTISDQFHDIFLRPKPESLGHTGFFTVKATTHTFIQQKSQTAFLDLPTLKWPAKIKIDLTVISGQVIVFHGKKTLKYFVQKRHDKLQITAKPGPLKLTFRGNTPQARIMIRRVTITNVVGYSSGFPQVYLTPGPPPINGPDTKGWFILAAMIVVLCGAHFLAARTRPDVTRAIIWSSGWLILPPVIAISLHFILNWWDLGLVWPLTTFITVISLPALIGLLPGAKKSALARWLTHTANQHRGEQFPDAGPAWWRRHGRIIVIAAAFLGLVIAAHDTATLVGEKAPKNLDRRYPGFAVTTLSPYLEKVPPSQPVGLWDPLKRPNLLHQVRFALAPRMVIYGRGPKFLIIAGRDREHVGRLIKTANLEPLAQKGMWGLAKRP